MVDENGAAVILKNNTPRYVLIDYGKLQADAEVDNEILEDVATGLLQKHRKAFEELAAIHRLRHSPL